jgi:hypothetical protein
MAAVALVGVLAGAAAMLAAQGSPGARSAEVTTTTVAPIRPVATVSAPTPRVLLVWTPGRLPPGIEGRRAADPAVERVTAVRGATVDLVESTDAAGVIVDRAPEGMAFPLDAMAFDPATYPTFLPSSTRAVFTGLGPGQALLGETSARIRRLEPGAALHVAGGRTLTVAGVVPDDTVGAAELVVPLAAAADLGVVAERYALVAYRGERADAERSIRAAFPAGASVRFRGPGEAAYLREGDAVLPQALIKESFGEFADRPAGGGQLSLDEDWQNENLVSTVLPVVGRLRCHRAVLPALRGAIDELVHRNLASLVETFDGCWNPRLVRNGSDISRHAWGVAVDMNFRSNVTRLRSVQDPRLVEVMERWGFTWGGRWLVPDAAHFEYRQAPAATTER